MKIKNMKIGKIQGFLQRFFRECKKDFDQHSEAGLWDEFLAHICKDYAEQSDSSLLKAMAHQLDETNLVYYRIPVKRYTELKQKYAK